MILNLVSGSVSASWPAVSGAIDGGIAGVVAGALTGAGLVKVLKTITRHEPRDAGHALKELIVFASSVAVGTVIGGAGGAAYQVGKHTFLLTTINSCGLAIAAGASAAVFSARCVRLV